MEIFEFYRITVNMKIARIILPAEIHRMKGIIGGQLWIIFQSVNVLKDETGSSCGISSSKVSS